MVKAGSLLYAVYICLLISVMSAALIFIFNFNLELSSRQSIQSDLVDLCDSCIDYYLSDSENFNDLSSEKLNLFDNGLECEFSKTKWGFYTRLTVKAFFKKDTIQKSAFVGERQDKEKFALYVCDWDEQLKVSGLTNIRGNMKLPLGSYKTINILGNNQLNKPILSGAIAKSSQTLPEIAMAASQDFSTSGINTTLSKLNKRSLIYNDFKKSPMVINLNKGEQLDNMSFKGNIIIKSIDTLYINNSTQIEDLIIQAPKVVVKNGFKGRAQFFADYEVFVEEEVLLDYPSSISVSSGNQVFQKKITLSKGSKIFGGIIIDASTFDEKENNKVFIEEGALIMGDIYCNAKLQLQGKVIGAVYAHKLQLETKSGNYENVLLNSKIDAMNLPKGFVKLPLFKKQENRTYAIIKTI